MFVQFSGFHKSQTSKLHCPNLTAEAATETEMAAHAHYGIASHQRMHQLSTTDRPLRQFVEYDMWIFSSVAPYLAARMVGVSCVLV